MRYFAGERIEAGEAVRIDEDGAVWRLRGRDHEYDVALEGGPADGSKATFPELPDLLHIKGGWHPADETSGVSDEYVPTDRRDGEGRTIYVHRRQRYTAEGGVWRPAS